MGIGFRSGGDIFQPGQLLFSHGQFQQFTLAFSQIDDADPGILDKLVGLAGRIRCHADGPHAELLKRRQLFRIPHHRQHGFDVRFFCKSYNGQIHGVVIGHGQNAILVGQTCLVKHHRAGGVLAHDPDDIGKPGGKRRQFCAIFFDKGNFPVCARALEQFIRDPPCPADNEFHFSSLIFARSVSFPIVTRISFSLTTNSAPGTMMNRSGNCSFTAITLTW